MTDPQGDPPASVPEGVADARPPLESTGETRATPDSRDPFFRFFANNPLIGIVGTLASLVGIPLAFYLSSPSRNAPDITYMVNPVKAVVARGGQTSRLSITLEGHPVEGDVTAAQIACWNAGRASIRKEHILRPFTLRTDPPVPIVDATIRKVTRNDIVGLSLDKSGFENGEVGVSWKILEGNDGGIIQLIFLGGLDTRILLDGTIEGQMTPTRAVGRAINGKVSSRQGFADTTLAIGLVFLLALFAGKAVNEIWFGLSHRPPRVKEALARLAAVAFPVGGLVYLLLALRSQGPPFGF